MDTFNRIPDYIPEEREHEYESLIRRGSAPLCDFVPGDEEPEPALVLPVPAPVEAPADEPAPKKAGKS